MVRLQLSESLKKRVSTSSINWESYGGLAGLIALSLVVALTTRQFQSLTSIFAILIAVVPTLIIAVGMTMVISTGGIDVSVGSVMAVSGALAFNIFSGRMFGIHDTLMSNIVAVIIALCVATAIGAFNGILISYFDIQPIVATLSVLIIGRGAAEVMIGTQYTILGKPFETFLNMKLFGFFPLPVLVAICIISIFAWIMYASAFSRYLLAAGGNRQASRLSGVPVNRILIMVYAISGFLAGIAGLIALAHTQAMNPFALGNGAELNAIAAVAVGGTPLAGGKATIFGTVIGALIIQLIQTTLVSLNVPADYGKVVSGVIILFAVYIQSQRRAV
jgi:galactofuranose transport system permease protein